MSEVHAVNEAIKHGQLTELLSSVLRRAQVALDDAPMLLTKIIDDGGWADFTTTRGEPVHHDTFESYVTSPPLRGLGVTMDLIDRIMPTPAE